MNTNEPCQGYGGDMVICHTPSPGIDWDPDSMCFLYGICADGDGGGRDNNNGGEGGGIRSTSPPRRTPPSNEYNPRNHARCIEDAGNDKAHCQAIAGVMMAGTTMLCTGFIFFPAQAACVAVATAGWYITNRDCEINFNAHNRFCSETFT